MEQFLTRFLLRETMHQLQSLQGSLECAVDTMEEQAGRERYWVLTGMHCALAQGADTRGASGRDLF